MKCRITIAGVSLMMAAMLSASSTRAQDVHFTQFDASPLTLNPANTGAFSGEWRASAIYRDQWRSIGANSAFKTYAASFDMPVIRDISIDDYLAAGVQVYNDRAGDGNLNQFSILGSVAYHKFFGNEGNKVLTIGLQGGYAEKSIDLSRLYFGDEFGQGAWNSPSAERGWLDPKMNNYVINAGIRYSQAVGERFSYTIGAGANNLNQPVESFDKRRKALADAGLGIRYTGQLGAIIGISDRFSLRPAVLVQSQSTAMELIGGTEFHYRLGEDFDVPTVPAVFAGVWYRSNDAIMATVGLEFNGFRVGLGYDITVSGLAAANNSNGGFEISFRYIAPSPWEFARQRLYPCGRF